MTFFKGDRIVFMHAEKTGGTTLHRILSELFDEDKICPERFEQISLLPKATLSKYDFFSAHASLQDLVEVPKPFILITILRDPLERTLSFYDYWRSIKPEFIEKNNLYGPRLAQKLTPVDFFAPHNNWRTKATNRYTELLTGCSPSRTGTELMSNFEERAEVAIRALDKFDFVALTEVLDESFDKLSQILDIPRRQKLPRLNVTNSNPRENPVEFEQKPPIKIDREVFDLIELLNRSDQIVYDYAVRKFYPSGRLLRNVVLQPTADADTHHGRDTNWYSRSGQGYLLHGPYCRLRPGAYTATFMTRIKGGSEHLAKQKANLEFDVVSEFGQNIIYELSIPAAHAIKGQLEITFTIPEIKSDIEFRIRVSNFPEIEFSNTILLELRN